MEVGAAERFKRKHLCMPLMSDFVRLGGERGGHYSTS
jgi:hypothetical protein